MANEKRENKAAKTQDQEFAEQVSPKQRGKKGKGDVSGKNNKEETLPGGKQKKKRKKGRLLKIIIILLLLGMIITVVLWFVRIIPDPTGYWEWRDYKQNSAILDQKQAELDQRKDELDEREAELDDRETSLNEQEKAQQAESDTVENNDDFESLLGSLSEEKLAEIENLASVYSKMDAAAAAAIMTEMYSNQDISLIIYYMKPAAAALVLANMSAELAAAISTIVVE